MDKPGAVMCQACFQCVVDHGHAVFVAVYDVVVGDVFLGAGMDLILVTPQLNGRMWCFSFSFSGMVLIILRCSLYLTLTYLANFTPLLISVPYDSLIPAAFAISIFDTPKLAISLAYFTPNR